MATSQSSVGVEGTSQDKFKFDKASPLWKYTTRISQRSGGGGFNWKCNFCKNPYSSSYYRVKLHFFGPSRKGITVCSGEDNKGLPPSKVAELLKEQEEADKLVSRGKKGEYSGKKKTNLTPQPTPTSRHPFLTIPDDVEDVDPIPTRKRGPLEKSFQLEARDIADQKIVRCLYACGLPFNLVRSPYWKDMITAINNAPQGYTGPGYEKVRTTLLQKEKKSIETDLQPIRDSWIEKGLSIVSDGWKDLKNRPLINVIAMSPKGAMFLKAVDCEGVVKDADFIASLLIESIEQVGSDNVVQVITDNAKVCRAAGILVEIRYPHIFWTPCTVHSLNLIMKSIGTKIDWIQKIYEEGEDIQMFVTNHHMSQAIFRIFSSLEMLKVSPTRFASHTIVLRRLVKVREPLSQMVISNQWGIWKQSQTERAQKVKERILNDDWWDRVNYILEFTDPIYTMIRFADTELPCLGDIYDGMDTMVEKIKLIIQAKENDPEDTLYNKVKEIVVDRWERMTTPLHLLAYALSPKYYSPSILTIPGRVAPYRDAEVAAGYKKAFSRIFEDPDIEEIVRGEFGDFVSGRNFSVAAIKDQTKRDAIQWWYLHGQEFKHLQPLAIKVLSQVASSSAAERNWSTYSFIHSVKRNRLAAKKAEDLVYIHSNLRLLSRNAPEYKKGPSMLWDVAPESVDFDATIQDLARATLADEEGASTVSGTAVGSNEQEEEEEEEEEAGAQGDDFDDLFD